MEWYWTLLLTFAFMAMVLKISITRGTGERKEGAKPVPKNSTKTPPDRPSVKREPPPARFLLGVIVPCLYAAAAFWFGFIKQKINVQTEVVMHLHNNRYYGSGAAWAASAEICFAFIIFAMFYASRKSYTPGYWYFLSGIALVISVACMFRAWSIS